ASRSPLFRSQDHQASRAPAVQRKGEPMSKEEAEAAIRQAHRAAKRGDLAEAERWGKTAERLAAAAEKLTTAPQLIDQDEEALRQELLARLRHLADAGAEAQVWEAEREVYERELERARRTGAPMPAPLRKNPYPEEELMRLAENVGKFD